MFPCFHLYQWFLTHECHLIIRLMTDLIHWQATTGLTPDAGRQLCHKHGLYCHMLHTSENKFLLIYGQVNNIWATDQMQWHLQQTKSSIKMLNLTYCFRGHLKHLLVMHHSMWALHCNGRALQRGIRALHHGSCISHYCRQAILQLWRVIYCSVLLLWSDSVLINVEDTSYRNK